MSYLIRRKDYKTLLSVVRDPDRSMDLRLHIIDSLSTMKDRHIEDELIRLAKEKLSEDALKKAAWRSVRRSRRYREKEEMEYSI